MKTLRFFLLSTLIACFLTPTVFAQTSTPAFMTPRDLLLSHSTASNINLRNGGGQAVTVYGIYVRQFGYVVPGNTCDTPSSIYATSQNTTGGSFVTPTAIGARRSAAVGSNYLYNMIYEAIYYASVISVPFPCALPGCTWGSDSTMYNWCIYLGALAPVNVSSPYSGANVPPSADLASGAGYDYNLVSSYVSLGPISCDDQSLVCTVASAQTQSFS